MKIKKNIYLMYAIALFHGMVFFGPISTLYRQAQGLSVFDITLIESISFLLCLVLEVPWGIVADKIGYKKTMVLCTFLFLLSKIIFWKADSFGWFLLERVLLSIVFAGLSGVDESILYLSCADGESQRVFGIHSALGVTGLLFASMIFSVFVGEHYQTAALLTVVSHAAAAVAALFLTEVKQEEQTRSKPLLAFKSTLLQVLKNKYLLLFLIAVALVSQTHETVSGFLNQVQYERCGLSASAIGYIFIGVTLAELLAVFSDRLTQKIGIRASGILLHIIPIGACILLSVTGSAPLSVCAVLSMHIAASLFAPLQSELLNKQVATSQRATELSIHAMVIHCISAAASVSLGAFAEVQLPWAFGMGAAFCAGGLVFFCIWYPKKQRLEIR